MTEALIAIFLIVGMTVFCGCAMYMLEEHEEDDVDHP